MNSIRKNRNQRDLYSIQINQQNTKKKRLLLFANIIFNAKNRVKISRQNFERAYRSIQLLQKNEDQKTEPVAKLII